MIIGMLWLYNPKNEFSKELNVAVVYYQKKYNKLPNTCLINPKALEKEVEIDSVSVRPYKYILPNHLWLGIEEKEG